MESSLQQIFSTKEKTHRELIYSIKTVTKKIKKQNQKNLPPPTKNSTNYQKTRQKTKLNPQKTAGNNSLFEGNKEHQNPLKHICFLR